MEKIKKGDLVIYEDSGYRYGNTLNEYGDLEVEDYCYGSYGRVLSVNRNVYPYDVLVLFYKKIGGEEIRDCDCIVLDELFLKWVDIEKLTVIEETYSLRLVENIESEMKKIKIERMEEVKLLEEKIKNYDNLYADWINLE